jgi:hypothetical protein
LLDLEAMYEQRGLALALELLEKEFLPGTPPHKLSLAVGMPLICIKNLSQIRGLCHGTPLSLEAIHPHTLEVKDKHDLSHELPRFYFDLKSAKGGSKDEMYCKRIQFPVIPAFALTFNSVREQRSRRFLRLTTKLRKTP